MASIEDIQKRLRQQEKTLAGADYAENRLKEKNKLNEIQREYDIAKGQETLGKEFSEGSLGRIDAGRSQNIQDIIASKKARLSGFTAEENQALREKGVSSINKSTQTALRNLRGFQGATGVRGGTAGSQQLNILKSGIQSKANVERDLFLQNIEEKRRNLQDFEASVTGAEATEQERNLFNIDQANKEKFGRLSAGLGYAQLGVTERASERGVAIAQQNLKAESSGGKL